MSKSVNIDCHSPPVPKVLSYLSVNSEILFTKCQKLLFTDRYLRIFLTPHQNFWCGVLFDPNGLLCYTSIVILNNSTKKYGSSKEA